MMEIPTSEAPLGTAAVVNKPSFAEFVGHVLQPPATDADSSSLPFTHYPPNMYRCKVSRDCLIELDHVNRACMKTKRLAQIAAAQAVVLAHSTLPKSLTMTAETVECLKSSKSHYDAMKQTMDEMERYLNSIGSHTYCAARDAQFTDSVLVDSVSQHIAENTQSRVAFLTRALITASTTLREKKALVEGVHTSSIVLGEEMAQSERRSHGGDMNMLAVRSVDYTTQTLVFDDDAVQAEWLKWSPYFDLTRAVVNLTFDTTPMPRKEEDEDEPRRRSEDNKKYAAEQHFNWSRAITSEPDGFVPFPTSTQDQNRSEIISLLSAMHHHTAVGTYDLFKQVGVKKDECTFWAPVPFIVINPKQQLRYDHMPYSQIKIIRDVADNLKDQFTDLTYRPFGRDPNRD